MASRYTDDSEGVVDSSAAGSPKREDYGDEDFEDYDDASDAAAVLRKSRRSDDAGALDGGPGAPKPTAPPSGVDILTDDDGERVVVRRSRQGMKALGVEGTPRKEGGGSADLRVSAIDLDAFVKTMATQRRPKGKKPTVWRQHRIDELAKPFKKRPKGLTSEDDRKNCKFMPKISRKSREMVQNRGGGGDGDMFLIRMESKEQARRKAVEKAIGEKEYNARHDRKACPDCGSYQTYSEWKAKIKRCQNERCPGREFRPKLAWGDVQGSFLERLESSKKQKEDKLEALRRKSAPNFRVAKKVVFDPSSGKPKEVPVKKKAWTAVRGDFLKRNEEDLAKRRENIKKLEEKGVVSNPLYSECTFKPKLSSTRELKEPGTFEERMLRDIEKRRKNKERKEKAAAAAAKPKTRRASRGSRGSRRKR